MCSVAFVAALVAGTAIGKPVIDVLRIRGARQTVSEDAPSSHAAKQGTPTMGGIIILVAFTAGFAAAWLGGARLSGAVPVCVLIACCAAIGLWDDLLIARRGKNLGLKARHKLALQVIAAIGFVCWLSGSITTTVQGVELGWAYYPLAVVLIVGLTNAVNLMDGLDGLAAGVCAIILVGIVLASSVHNAAWSVCLAASLAGGCCAFLWFNCHPAQVFMGDTGSLALGGAIAGLALAGKLEVPTQVFAVVPWIETLSVIGQVAVFKVRKAQRGLAYAQVHRLFRRTPLHHHFEELGMPETRIVARFWLASAAAVALGLLVWR